MFSIRSFFFLLLFTATGVYGGNVMLTGNYGPEYQSLKGVPPCQENQVTDGFYKFAATVWPNVRKDVRAGRGEKVSFAQGLLTDGSLDRETSSVLCDNNLRGKGRPDPTYVTFHFKQPCLVSAILVVPAYFSKGSEDNLMLAKVRFSDPDGNFPQKENWELLGVGNFYTKKTPQGQRPPILVFRPAEAIETRSVTIYLNGFRRVGISEVFILGHSEKVVAVSENTEIPRIVIPDQPNRFEYYAAELLSDTIKQMIGQAIPVVAQHDAAGNNLIFVGRCKANKLYQQAVEDNPAETSYVRSGPDGAHLLGREGRGTVYAAVSFLEAQGCRWVTPAPYGTVIPRRKQLDLKRLNIKEVPRFTVRQFIAPGDPPGKTGSRWLVLNRINHPYANSGLGLKGMGMTNWGWAHTYNRIVPPELYEKHPDYFALTPDGKRQKYGYNFCTTHPETIKLGIQKVLHSDADMIVISPDDGTTPDKYCMCQRCRALDVDGESRTDRVIAYANHLADALAKKKTSQKIQVLAYSSHLRPPKVHMPRDNIIIQYCIGGNYGTRMSDPLDRDNYDQFREIKQWKRITKHMEIWGYYQNGYHTVAPYPILNAFAGTLDDFESLGIDGMYTMSQSVKNRFPLFRYVMARMLWQRLSLTDILEDICPKYYGRGGDLMRRYFLALEDRIREKRIKITSCHWDFTDDYFSSEFIKELWSYLNTAHAKAKTKQEKLRIDQERIGLVCAELYVNSRQSKGDTLKITDDRYIINPDIKPASADKLALLDTLSKRLGIIHVSNLDGKKKTIEVFKKACSGGIKNSYKIVKIQNNHIEAHLVPSLGGRILRLMDNKGFNYFYTPTKLDLSMPAPDFGGYEEYAGPAFASNGWSEDYSYKLSPNKTSITMSVTLKEPNVKIVRKVWLEENKPVLHIKSTMFNLSNKKRYFMLRVHPTFWLSREDDAKVLTLEKDKWIVLDQREPSKSETWFINSDKPSGVWAIEGPLGRKIINRFDPEQIDKCYVFWGSLNPKVHQHMTIELFGKRQLLAPKESLTIEHSYQIISETQNTP